MTQIPKNFFKRILVTGCGGDIGLSLGEILKSTGIGEEIWGLDVNSNHAGLSIFNNCQTIEPSSSPGYLAQLSAFVKKQGIDLLIPASEPEQRRLFQQGAHESLENIPVIMANAQALDVGFDKLRTAEFLRQHGLPSPWTKPVSEGLPEEFPCIFKARTGSGSKSVIKVRDFDQALDLQRRQMGEIWQEYLSPDDQEYTCGLFRSRQGDLRAITFKRKLQGGLTGSGEVVEDKRISTVLEKLASSVDLRGSINVQLRLTEKGPIIFEINPRFSSTVGFRHRLGFRDLLWSIADRCGFELGNYKSPKTGTRFYRLAREVIFPA